MFGDEKNDFRRKGQKRVSGLCRGIDEVGCRHSLSGIVKGL